MEVVFQQSLNNHTSIQANQVHSTRHAYMLKYPPIAKNKTWILSMAISAQELEKNRLHPNIKVDKDDMA